MKIKKVNIVGFRSYAYDGDGLFDFTGRDGKISNFVAIYGPNGFGKSSIYDAIEWSMTNSISRYNRDSQRINNNSTSLALNQKGLSQHILRNRYIDDSDPSFVDVETTTHGTFHRPLKKAKSGSRDYKFDPKETDANTKHLADIFLSQDAIDSFLKEERAEGRYEKFMSGFGGEDEIYRQKLFILRRTSHNEREKISLLLENLKSRLTESGDKEAAAHVAHTVRRLKQHNLQFELNIEDITPAQHIENRNKILLYLEDYAKRIINLENSLHLTNVASAKIPEYSHLANQVKMFEGERVTYITQLDTITKINKIQRDIQILEDMRHTTLILLNESRKESEHLENFIRIRDLLKSISLIISKLEEKRDGISGVLAGLNSNVNSKNIALAELRQKTLLEKAARIEVPKIFRDLENIESDLTALHLQKTDVVDSRLALLDRQKAASDARSQLLSLIIDEAISPESVIRATGSHEIAIEFSAVNSEKSSVNDRIKAYRELLSQVEIRDKKLLEIVRIGSEYVAHTKNDTCPLCSSRYDSNRELMSRIHSNDGISSEQSAVLNLIKKEEEIFSDLDKNISACIIKIDSIRKEQILGRNNDIEAVIKLIDECDTKIREVTLKIELLNQKKTDLAKKIGGLSEKEFYERRAKNIENIDSAIKRILVELSDFAVQVINATKSLDEVNSVLASERERFTNTSKHAQYLSTLSYLKKNFVEDGKERIFFEHVKNEYASKIDGIVSEVEEKQKQVKVAQDNLSKFKLPNDPILINQKIIDIDQVITQAQVGLKSIIDSIVVAGPKILPSNITSVEDVSKVLAGLRGQLEVERQTCVEVQGTLNLLEKQLGLALELAEMSRTTERLTSLQKDFHSHVEFETFLEQEFQNVESRLKQRINEFFYEELINNIYSKIDPHPSFKKIDFTCVFPENGDKPRLEIYLREEGGEPISPSLYFSAAQLNVLSLSIFLARALHVTHEGAPVQAILIDDPIQSMDSINILSTVDLLRGISQKFNRQIILSTHDENFFELLKMKVPESKFNSKFIKLAEFGKVDARSIAVENLFSPGSIRETFSNDNG